MKTITAVLALVPMLLFSISACAHDIWLFPERFILAKGDTLTVHQVLGEEIDAKVLQPGGGTELPLLWRMTPRFELISANGSIDLLEALPAPKPGTVIKPILSRLMENEGLALVAMDHAFIIHHMSNEEFSQYVEHEEFDISALPTPDVSRLVHRENYARYFKSLVQIGEAGPGESYKQPVGQKIEIILFQNPYLLNVGDTLDLKVLFNGKPLSNQLVWAYNGDGRRPVSRIKRRTDGSGVARLKLSGSGFWLIRLVHQVPCSIQTEEDCSNVDWESYWASYTFQLD